MTTMLNTAAQANLEDFVTRPLNHRYANTDAYHGSATPVHIAATRTSATSGKVHVRIGTIRAYAMRRIVRNFPALGCAGFLILAAGKGFSQTSEATHYVSPAGSDTRDGRTVGTAFRTIGKAAAIAQAGDLVWIRGGTYREYVRLLNTGTNSARITFEAFPGEQPVLDGSDLPTDVTKAWTQPAVLSIGGRYVTVRGLEIRNGASHGIVVWQSGANAVLDRLHVHHVYAVGIHPYLTWDVTISNSRIHDADDYGAEGNDADCINAGGYSAHGRHIIRDNEVYNCADDGIDRWTSSGNALSGNLVHHAGMGFRGDGNGFVQPRLLLLGAPASLIQVTRWRRTPLRHEAWRKGKTSLEAVEENLVAGNQYSWNIPNGAAARTT